MVALRWLVVLLVIVVSNAASWQRLEAAQRQAIIQVSATVVDPARVRSVQHVQSVLVTPNDITRGFVDVPFGSRITLEASSRCVIELTASGSFFRAVVVSNPHGAGRIEPGGAPLRQRACGGSAASVDLSYRFELGPAAQPGLYRWPVVATVQPF